MHIYAMSIVNKSLIKFNAILVKNLIPNKISNLFSNVFISQEI